MKLELLNAVLALTITISVCQQNPTISYITREQVVNIGDSVSLVCAVQNAENYPVLWVKINEENPSNNLFISTGSVLVLPDRRYSIRHDERSSSFSLQITKSQESDAGRYQCQIIISSTNRTTADVWVFVRTPPVISDNSTRSVITSEGSTVTLHCYAAGYPPPRIDWRRENNDLLSNGAVVYRGNVLTIHNITKDDRGTYHCIADNGVGRAIRRDVGVEVEFAPIVTVDHPRYDQTHQNNTGLQCHVEAYPAPSIVWLKDGFQLNDDQHYKISIYATADEFTDASLQFIHTGDEQYGNFTCKAVNKLGSDEKNIELFIPPVISDNSTSSVITSAGATVTLHCYATGLPPPHVTWRRENNDLLPTEGAVYEGNDLIVHNVTKNDRGTYYCFADNGVGRGARRNVSVEVEFAPTVTVDRPRYEQALQYDVDLLCHVEAFPAPSIIWLKDGIQLDDDQHYKTSIYATANELLDTSLRIIRIEKEQYGNFTCKAVNKLGSDEKNIELFESVNAVHQPVV